MILNASITLIKAPPVADATGKRSYGAGTTVSVRCFLDAPSRAQRAAIDTRISTADAVAYVPKPSSLSLVPGSRVTIGVDDSAAIEYELGMVIDRQKDGGLSHFEFYLRKVGG
jgi:hypothetical protein